MGTIVLRIVLGLVVLSVIGFVISVVTGTRDDKAIDEAKVGDCLNLDLEDEELLTYDPKSCDSSHVAEVFASFEHPAASGAPYPGRAAIEELAGERCRTEFESYIGINYDESSLDAFPVYPVEDTWEDGDRGILCLVTGAEGIKLERSVRGAAI